MWARARLIWAAQRGAGGAVRAARRGRRDAGGETRAAVRSASPAAGGVRPAPATLREPFPGLLAWPRGVA